MLQFQGCENACVTQSMTQKQVESVIPRKGLGEISQNLDLLMPNTIQT